MSNQVTFTAFCPECNGHRTFTIIGSIGHPDTGRLTHKIGCCVCGTSEREALVAVSDRMQDDRATIGEISARINTLDGEVAELREELHASAVTPHVSRAHIVNQPDDICCTCNMSRVSHLGLVLCCERERHSVKVLHLRCVRQSRHHRSRAYSRRSGVGLRQVRKLRAVGVHEPG